MEIRAGGKDKLCSQEPSEGAPDERLLLVWECYFLSFSCARAFGWSWIYPRQAALVWGTPRLPGPPAGFSLTVDPKAAADAGSKSRLGELSTVATSKKVAEVNYVGKDDLITYNKGTNTDSPTQATSSLGQQQFGGVTLFEQGSTPQSPANDLGYNSATPGATEIYVDPLSSHNLLDTGDPLMHETLEHFYPFTQTGDANQSAHPTEMPPKEDKPQ